MSKIIYLFTLIFVFAFPFFSLPFTSEFYDYNKMFLLVFFSLFLIILQSINVVRKKRIEIIGSSYGTYLFLIACFAVISTIFQSPNFASALTTPLGTSTLICGFLLYSSLVHLIKDNNTDEIYGALAVSTQIISFYVLLLYFGFIPNNPITPTGTILSAAIFLLIIIITLTVKLTESFTDKPKHEHNNQKDNSMSIIFGKKKKLMENYLSIVYTFSLVMSVTAFSLVVYHLFSDQQPILLPFSFSWTIFVETLKNFKTLFMGVGPSNFITAFTLTKPVSINYTPFWTITFTSSSSFLLTLATETGIFAAISYMLCLVTAFKNMKTKSNLVIPFIPVIIALVFQIFFPSSMTIYILTIILMSTTAPKKQLFEIDLTNLGLSSLIMIIPSLVIYAAFLYFGGKTYLAEVYYKKSLDAGLVNKTTEVYNYQTQAIAQNPFNDRYHVALSQSSFLIANNLASKKNLTKEEESNINKLIQQSINESRNAVILNRTNIVNWDNLARTYGSLISYAKGADSWTIQTYQQKIILDPNNPNNWLNLGGIFYGFNKYPEAENNFRQAVKLKNNLANAHYNLALALLQQKKYEGAYQEFTLLKSLLKDSTNEMNIINNSLSQLSRFYHPDDATSSALLNKNTQSTSSASQNTNQEESSLSGTISENETKQRFETPSSTESALTRNMKPPKPIISVAQPPISPGYVQGTSISATPTK
jgi:tetratricopeptide (TPR) repeat protein